ncbi:MAG: peptidase inhibitor family I36 protein [Pseudonocardiaceae bacterium]
MKSKRLIAAIAGAVALSGGLGVAVVDDDKLARAAVASSEGAAPAPRAGLDCRETANTYKDNDKLYLYARSYCEGAHDRWDDDDSDYGDDKGRIKDFDNKVDSIVNTTDENVAFFNEPNYHGDSFCVRPGEYVRRLYVYGDGSGTNDWWSNSISSHKFVAANDCDRWFGWLVKPKQ